MPINEERLNRMKELGLTEYQARVYLALLDLGVAKASQIPPLSRVPRTRIYSTMNQLHEKGLVEIIPESPIRYRPVPLGDYLERVAESHKKKAESVLRMKDELIKEFSVRIAAEAEEVGRFEAIYGRRNVRERLSKMYEEAKSEILSVGTIQSPTRIFRSRLPTIEEKFKNGVEIRYAFPIDTTNRDHAQILSQYADVRRIDLQLSMYFLVVDSKQALLCHPIPPDENFLKGDDIAIWTDDEGIAEALRNIAISIFETGSDLYEVDYTTPMLRSAKSLIELLDIDPEPIFKSLAHSIGQEMSSALKSTSAIDLAKELSRFWERKSIGEFKILKKRPLTIQVSQLFRCGSKRKGKPHIFCRFIRSMLDSIIQQKLNGESRILEQECLGESGGRCRMNFVIGPSGG